MIETQNGYIFEGYKEYLSRSNDKVVKEGFSGVISEDLRHLYLIDHIEGVSIGELLGPDTASVYTLAATNSTGADDSGVMKVRIVKVS
ncbi:MAG TPA: hypothetical protein PK024_12575 [Methanospirillum sp.]|uniref:hypothetical protein n=1 Tax=Methanospirillum sp. TaxID=45200 RepID=UPI002C5C77C1|nr:hypothetical protein [Methanospirillum sp.]HOJ97659.1 hypothetical protein [Methanospirillum sp.]HOL42384.1 hypothetical protein [Methanospirillum sp.]HPP79115.1 hypothetical protein [Methanospirillum sp.]